MHLDVVFSAACWMNCSIIVCGFGRFSFGSCGVLASIGVYVVHWCGLAVVGVLLVCVALHSMNAYVIVMSCRHCCIACLMVACVVLRSCIGGCGMLVLCLLSFNAMSFACSMMYLCMGLVIA